LQVLRKLRSESEIKVLDDIIRIAPQLLSQIISMTGVDIPEDSHIFARTLLKIGLGISGGVCLGWADTKGFHMVGVQGRVSAAASIGADVLAGLHHSRKFVKAILGISNICVEMVFELPEKASGGTAGVEGEAVSPAVIKETVAQGDAQRAELGVEKPVSGDAAPPVMPAAAAGAAPQSGAAGEEARAAGSEAPPVVPVAQADVAPEAAVAADAGGGAVL
jgi:hypothetical protein